MQCKIHNPAAITDRISWTEEIGNLYSPPPRQLRIGKWHILAFAQLHPRLFGGVWGGGGGWLAVPFYSVQDCSQDYCERKSLYL